MSKYDKQSQRDMVARNLDKLLRQHNKKQVDIVNDLGMSQSIVSDYFGARRYPPPDKMQMLADYFGVLMSDIMQEKPTPKDELSQIKKDYIKFVGSLDDEQVRTLLDIARSIYRERDK